MKIIAGRSTIELTNAVCKILNIKPIIPTYKRFSDGEISIDISSDDLPDNTCLLIHSLSEPVNESIATLLLTINALKRSGADKIIVCLPYLAYTRQEHTLSLMTSLMQAAGAYKFITIAPHSVIKNLTIPMEILSTTQLFTDHIKGIHALNNLVIVAPDKGGIERCKKIHEELELQSDLVIIDKIRKGDICTVQYIHGNIQGKNCIIVDDIIDTGATLCNAAKALKQHGASDIFAYCIHGVLSKGALDQIQQSPIKKLIITNTISPQKEVLNTPKINVMDVTIMISQHIQHILN